MNDSNADEGQNSIGMNVLKKKQSIGATAKNHCNMSSLAMHDEMLSHKRFNESTPIKEANHNKTTTIPYSYDYTGKCGSMTSEKASVPKVNASNTADEFNSIQQETREYLNGLFR